MKKDVIIYMVSVAFSILAFYMVLKKQSDILKRKKEELKMKKEITNNLIFMFEQMMKK